MRQAQRNDEDHIGPLLVTLAGCAGGTIAVGGSGGGVGVGVSAPVGGYSGQAPYVVSEGEQVIEPGMTSSEVIQRLGYPYYRFGVRQDNATIWNYRIVGAGLDSRCASGHHAAMSKELELFHWWFHDDITGQRRRTPFAMDRETATQLYGSVQADEPTRVLRTISEAGEAPQEQMLPQFQRVEGGSGPGTAPRH